MKPVALGLLITMLSTLGCLDQPVGEPGIVDPVTEAAAMTNNWNLYYGMTAAPAKIYYVTGAALNCGDNHSFIYGDYGCVDGMSGQNGDWISLAWPQGMTFGKSALSHENRHIVARLTVGNEWGGTDHDSEIAAIRGHKDNTGVIWGIPDGEVGRGMEEMTAAGF